MLARVDPERHAIAAGRDRSGQPAVIRRAGRTVDAKLVLREVDDQLDRPARHDALACVERSVAERPEVVDQVAQRRAGLVDEISHRAARAPSLKVSAECGSPGGRLFRYFDVASTRIARASPESGRNDARTSVPADSCSADAVCPFSITCGPESIFSGRGLFSSWISDDVARAILPVTSVVPEAEPADAACCDACPDCSCACPACRWACAWEVCCCWSACWARCCACTPSLCARCASVPALACACWASLCCFLAFSSFSCRSLRAFSTSLCAVFTCSCSRVAFFCASSARLKSASARCCSVLTGSPPCRPCCALSLQAENANNPIAAIAHAVRIAVLRGHQMWTAPGGGERNGRARGCPDAWSDDAAERAQ